jgi:hypothetical protein
VKLAQLESTNGRSYISHTYDRSAQRSYLVNVWEDEASNSEYYDDSGISAFFIAQGDEPDFQDESEDSESEEEWELTEDEDHADDLEWCYYVDPQEGQLLPCVDDWSAAPWDDLYTGEEDDSLPSVRVYFGKTFHKRFPKKGRGKGKGKGKGKSSSHPGNKGKGKGKGSGKGGKGSFKYRNKDLEKAAWHRKKTPNRFPQDVCWEFAKGKTCKYGDKCRFKHSETKKEVPARLALEDKPNEESEENEPPSALVAPAGSRSKKQPSAEYPCAQCGATNHWYKDCPQVSQEKKDRYRKVVSKVPAMTAAQTIELDRHLVLEEAKRLWREEAPTFAGRASSGAEVEFSE